MTKRSNRPKLLMNASNLARHLGVSPSAISQAIARGEIVPEPSGLIDVALAEATFGRRRSLRAGERAENREAVARREQAITTRVAAHVMLARRKTEQARVRLAERNRASVEVNVTISNLHTYLSEHRPADPLLHEAIGNIAHDLGDLIAEGMRISRL
jgi:hypothetical protein